MHIVRSSSQISLFLTRKSVAAGAAGETRSMQRAIGGILSMGMGGVHRAATTLFQDIS